MSIHYAPNVRGAGAANTKPDGWAEEQWHQDAIADTGTSHTLPGRLYVVQCEWCPDAFAALTKAEAMALFREHESKMLAGSGKDDVELVVIDEAALDRKARELFKFEHPTYDYDLDANVASWHERASAELEAAQKGNR